MRFLRALSAIPLLLATHGFRIKRGVSDPTVASNPNEHPASPACLMASGFGLLRGCQYPEAMQPVPNCNSAAFNQACYQVSNAEAVRGFLRDVRSSSDYSSLTRSVTEAEGGGFGVSVSASFSYMKRSQVSERSIAFFIGASGRTETRSIQRPVAMRLTGAAKEILQRDPSQFLVRHGLRYIHSITYGGSFLGSFTLNSRETADDRDVQAFANLSVSKGFFSASGSTEFQNTLSQQGLNVSVFSNANWVGGSNIVQDYSNPETMNTMFQDWDRSWRSSPAPITVATRRWSDSEEVQAIVNSMSVEDQALFNSPDISNGILREISEENAKVTLVDTSVRMASAWNELQNYPAAASCLNDLSRDVSRKSIVIDLLDEASILVIQQQWLAGDYSWFEADSFNARYLACVQDVEVPIRIFERRVACENPGDHTFPGCLLPVAGMCYGRVKMGLSGRWSSWRDVNGQFDCSNNWFGGDPFKDQAKECICETEHEEMRVACENPGAPTSQFCRLPNTEGVCYGQVRMGHGHSWTPWTVTNGQFHCSTDFFGQDPAYGQAKECICRRLRPHEVFLP